VNRARLALGLSADELDFIINFDFKYRMGADGSDDEDQP
jgi:hypothetical protein